MQTLYYFLILLGLTLVFYNAVIELRSFGSRALVISPLLWFSFFFALIHLITPLMKHSAGRFRYTASYDESTGVIVVLCAIFSYLAIVFIIRKGLKRDLRRWRQSQKNGAKITRPKIDQHRPKVLVFALLLLAIGGVTAMSVIGSHGGQGRLSIGVGQGYVRTMPNFLFTALIILLFLYFTKKDSSLFRFINVVGLLLCVLLLFYFGAASNSRNTILIAIVFAVSMYAVFRPFRIYFSIRSIVGIGMLCCVFAIAFQVFYGFTLARYSASDNQYNLQRRDNVLFYAMDGAFGNDESLLWLIESRRTQPIWGVSYVAGFANFIPRGVWPEKPLGGGPRLRNEIIPGSYVVGREGNSSFTTGMFTEAFMNFKWFGFIFIVVLWCSTAQFCIRRILRDYGTVHCLPWMVLLISLSTMFIYSEFLGYLVRIIFITFPLFFISLLIRSKI